MKLIEINDDVLIYVGTAREIKSLYNNLAKHKIANPLFAEAPKFKKDKVYGLRMSYDEFMCENTMNVVNASTVLDMMFDLF